MNEDTLGRIEAKVSALLVIAVDRYLRESGIARPKQRSIDKMLADVGLSARDIASVLGKTERAVQLQLQKERTKRSKDSQPATPEEGGDSLG